MNASYVNNPYGDSIINGLTTGLSTMLVLTLVLLPISYVMNTYIYHSGAMRLVLGIIAGVGSILSVLVLFGARIGMGSAFPKAHYFGLMPLKQDAGLPGPWAYFDLVRRTINMFLDPFNTAITDATDINAFKGSIEKLLVKELPEPIKKVLPGAGEITVRPGVVSEEFFEAAREVGEIVDYEGWKREMRSLEESGIGQLLFTA